MKLYVLTFVITHYDDGLDYDITYIVAVCGSMKRAKELAQQAVIGDICWCNEEEGFDYTEACNPTDEEDKRRLVAFPLAGILTDRRTKLPVQFLVIRPCELDELNVKYLENIVTVG